MLKNIGLKFYFAYLRFLDEGFLWTLREVVIRFFIIQLYFFLLPITLVLRFIGYRFLTVNTGRIGHLAGEVDCFLKMRELDLINMKYKYFIFVNPIICNNAFWQLIKNSINVINNPILCFGLRSMCAGPGIRFDVSKYLLAINGAAKYYEVCRIWSERPPIFSLGEDNLRLGSKLLIDLGVPPNSSYVCIHIRSPGYAKDDDGVHSHRNFSMESMNEAIDKIISRGYFCILMGDPSSPKIQKTRNIIDYAHSAFKNDINDIFLCATAKFFLGNSSGLFIVSTVFGVPSALTNMLPFTCTGFTIKDLSIPKLLKRLTTKKYLNYSEILSSGVAEYRNSKQYEINNIEVVSNTSDEILNLVSDMFFLLDGDISVDEIRKINEKFIDNLRPNSYCYKTSSFISPSFLKKHNNIFN